MEEQLETMETMESLLESNKAADVKKGAEVTGKVVSKTDSGWLVDVGYKCEGFLPAKEWTQHALIGDAKEPTIGDDITVQVLSKREGEEAQLLVSRWRCELERRWKEIEDKSTQSDIMKVKGLRKTKGGLMVECCGLEGFVPLSHILGDNRGGNLDKFVGEEFDAKLIEKDHRKHRLVFSRKSLMEKEAKSGRERFYNEVTEGMEVDGEVSSLTTFGVFVNIGYLDGLVHMTELSWKRSTKMKEFKKGDKVRVKVIGIDREKDRISLSIKQTLTDPWDTVSERWQKDMVIKAPITNVTEFGAFVELEPGVEGLIHIGDISWGKVKHPKEVLRKNQDVEVCVLDVDTNKRRISLGYKQLNDPWNKTAEKYEKGQDVNVKVVRLTEFGAFVEIEDGVEGLIHISQLSHKRVEHPKDVLAEKQEMTARIIEISPEKKRIRLSLRALEEAPAHEEQSDRGERSERSGGGERRERSDRSERNDRGDRGGKKRGSSGGGKDRDHKESSSFVNDGAASVSMGEFFKNAGYQEQE